MSRERQKSSRLRLFVALELPEETLTALDGWGREALADPALRPLAAESLHITLAFLGYRPDGDVERAVAALKAARAPAPAIELLDPVARPARGRARLFALPVRSAGAESLQARVQEVLAARGLYKPEQRGFWPHVTVARVRSEGRRSKRPMRVATFPGPLPEGVLRTCVRSVRMGVYRSDLKPQGAKYTPLAQVELPEKRGRQ